MKSKFEIKAQKELEADGWLVDWKVKPFRTPRGYNVDYWGLFDLLAYQGGLIRGIAIKGQGGVPKALREAVENFQVCEHFVKEIWYYSRHTVNKKKQRNFTCKKEIIA
jgi:shikimate 5-dehydrogenase